METLYRDGGHRYSFAYLEWHWAHYPYTEFLKSSPGDRRCMLVFVPPIPSYDKSKALRTLLQFVITSLIVLYVLYILFKYETENYVLAVMQWLLHLNKIMEGFKYCKDEVHY